MFIVYAFVAAGLAVWLWLLRPWLAARDWHRSYSWATSGAVGSAIVAAGSVSDWFSGKEAPDTGLFFAGLAVSTLLVNVARNIWQKIAEKAGFSGFGGGVSKGHMRGAALVDEAVAARQLKHKPSRFSVGAVPVPVELETRGFLLAGSPGTGKSQTLTHALDALRADGQRAVIADASGIYTSRYCDEKRGDVILNPFDLRAVAWSPLAELEGVADIPSLAKSLVPDGEGGAAEWNGYAQTFVEIVLEHCFTNSLTNGELFHFILSSSNEDLREICAGTPAQPLLAEGNEKMFGSIRGIAGSAAKFLRYLDPTAGVKNGFSIRRFVVAENHNGWLFLSYQQQHRDALKAMIACATDIASRAVLSLPPSHDRRVVFALDELPLLGKIQSIIDLATNGRKHGAMIFAGLQTISQLREAYGNETSQTFLACLGSWLVLRVSDGETAEYMSRYLGEEEKMRKVESGGTSSQILQAGSTSKNWQEQVVKDRVVLASELQSMPDLRGIFNLAGPSPSAVVNLRIAGAHTEAEAFITAPARVRVKPQVRQQEQKQAGGASRDATAEIDALDLL